MFNVAAEIHLSSEEVVERKSDVSLPFTLVTTSIQTTIRNNSLYQLVTDLLLPCEAEIKENSESSLLADYRVEALTDDKAWLIHLDTEPENVLFSEAGFEFQDSHLRVDALFAKANTLKAKQGFSACHYTAEYKNLHTNALIVVHAYIGKNGIISYQIKKYKSEDDKKAGIGTDLPVNSTLKDLIQENAKPAVMLAESLQKKKQDIYMQAKKTSYEIEAKLNTLLQKIFANMQSDNRLALKAEYGVLVQSFLAAVDIINRYNDQEIDQRGVLWQQSYALMNRPVVAIKTAESKKASEEQTEPTDLLDKLQITMVEENLSPKAKSNEELQAEEDAARAIVLIAELKPLMKQLKLLSAQKNVLKTDELILCHTLKQAVNLKLIELAFLSSLTPKNNAYLEHVAVELNKIPVLLEAFKQAVELGELDRVMQLHSQVQHQNLMPIFNDLILKRLVPSSGEELNKIMAMAEFFFEHSNCYREFIKVCDQAFISGVGCHYSLLFRAFMRDNYLAFELMLNQGFNPNGIGLVCEEVTASVLNSITYFMGSATSKFTDTRYLKALLSFGALVDNKTPNVASNVAEATHSGVAEKQVKKLLSKHKMHMSLAAESTRLQVEAEDFDSLRLKKILSFDSALKMLCFMNQLPKLELLELLAPQSNLSSLVVSLVSLINVNDVKTRLVIGTEMPYFIGCSNVMEADAIQVTLSVAEEKHVTHIAYHTNPERAVIYLKNLEPLIKTLYEKYDEVLAQDPGQIDTLDKSLIDKAKITEDLIDKTNLLTAALYLQLLNPQCSFQNAQKIVQRLCYLGQAYFYHRFFDPVSKVRSAFNFQNALLCCTKLQCSKELQTTPLFNFVKKQLALLGVLPALPLTLAAQNYARQAPSLTALAIPETKSAPPVASAEEKPKKKKKKGKH